MFRNISLLTHFLRQRVFFLLLTFVTLFFGVLGAHWGRNSDVKVLNKTVSQQRSTWKTGFLNISISRNQIYSQTHTHTYNHIHTHILTWIRNQTRTDIYAHIYSFSYLYSLSGLFSNSHPLSYSCSIIIGLKCSQKLSYDFFSDFLEYH